MKYIDAKWHYPQKGEYPVICGEYEHKHYPQIPCLVFYHGVYGVRFWNCTEECWDDEECDDFYCSKEEVEKWMYIDSLEQEQQEVDLEKEINKWLDGPTTDLRTMARHFAEWSAERFAKIVRENLSEIGTSVQTQFEQLYSEITGTKMYGGYND